MTCLDPRQACRGMPCSPRTSYDTLSRTSLRERMLIRHIVDGLLKESSPCGLRMQAGHARERPTLPTRVFQHLRQVEVRHILILESSVFLMFFLPRSLETKCKKSYPILLQSWFSPASAVGTGSSGSVVLGQWKKECLDKQFEAHSCQCDAWQDPACRSSSGLSGQSVATKFTGQQTSGLSFLPCTNVLQSSYDYYVI